MMVMVLNDTRAASFYKKIMSYVQKVDNDFSRLAPYFSKTENGNRLKVDKIHFACCIDSLPSRSSDYDETTKWSFQGQKYCPYLEFAPKDLENAFIPQFNKAYLGIFKIEKINDGYTLFSFQNELEDFKRETYQKIFFGAPGTGKSHTIKSKYLADVPEDNIFRTTFHPDYDYAQFVGSYKPIQKNVDFHGISFEKLQDEYKRFEKDEFGYPLIRLGLKYCKSDILKDTAKRNDLIESVRAANKKVGDADSVATGLTLGNFFCDELAKSEISYQFVPQVFAKAVKAAFDNPEKQIYLVIEEINRGNCAQIFGDIFQLLDRDENGESRYSINLDSDFAAWLGQDTLRLPANFNILATMNTSDQSLFPMDSAFKRRFDWEYVPISFEGKSAANFQIEIGSSENVKYYSWQTFVEKVNAKILDLTESEDKQLGEYFIQPDKKLNDSDTEKTVISEERFKGKVMFYLWNEICKDEHKNGSFFKIENDFFTFQDLYKDDSKLAAFMEEIEKTGKN